MRLDCYRLKPEAPPLTIGEPRRDWMDASPDRFAYRCLPLTMANASGWELRCPTDVKVSWNGKADRKAVTVSGYDPHFPVRGYVQSHFGAGLVTFVTGWLFRTPPGWAVWTTGAPNAPKDGAYPLTGLVETDWLPFPFTMNWVLTRPGEVVWKKGEPFCFLTLIEHARLDAVRPQVHDIADDPELKAEYDAWSRSRTDFIQRLEEGEPVAMKEAWQRFYMRGETAEKTRAPAHATRRKLSGPAKPRRP